MFRYFTGYTNKSMEKTSSLKVLKMNTINLGSYYISTVDYDLIRRERKTFVLN